MDTSKLHGASGDANLMIIAGTELESKSFHNRSAGYHIAVQVAGYNPRDVLTCLLEDYGYDKIQEMLNDTNS